MSDWANDPQQLARYIHFREDGRRRQNELDEAFQKAIHFQLAEWYGFDCFIYEAANLFAEAGRVIANAGVADAIPTPETYRGRYVSPELLTEALGVVRSAISQAPIGEIVNRLHHIRKAGEYLWARWVWHSIASCPKSRFRAKLEIDRARDFPNWQELEKQNARAQEQMTAIDRGIRDQKQTHDYQSQICHRFKTEVEHPFGQLLPQWGDAWEDLYAHLRQNQSNVELSIQSAGSLVTQFKRIGGLLQQLARPLMARTELARNSAFWPPIDVRERLGWTARRVTMLSPLAYPPGGDDPLSLESDYQYRQAMFWDKTPAYAAELLLSAIGVTEAELASKLQQLLSPETRRSLLGWLPLIRNWLLFPDPPADLPTDPPFGPELTDYRLARKLMTGEESRNRTQREQEQDGVRTDSSRAGLESLMACALRRSKNVDLKMILVSLPLAPTSHRYFPECQSCESGSLDAGLWLDEVFHWPFRCKDHLGSVPGSRDHLYVLSSDFDAAVEFQEFARQAGAAIALATPIWLEPIEDRGDQMCWAATIMNWSPSAKRMAKTLPSGIRLLEDAWAASAAALRDVLTPPTVNQTPGQSDDAPRSLKLVTEKVRKLVVELESQVDHGTPARDGWQVKIDELWKEARAIPLPLGRSIPEQPYRVVTREEALDSGEFR